MDREFEFEEVKRLCDTHMQILKTIRHILTSRANDADRVKTNAKPVFNSNVIASEIAAALQTGNITAAIQPCEKALLRELYVYKEGEQLVSIAEDKEQLRNSIIHDINKLKSVSSSLRWFFAGKSSKAAANTAYTRLIQLIQSDYPNIIREAEKKSKELDSISVNNAYSITSRHEHEYAQSLLECSQDLIQQTKLLPEIERIIRQNSDVITQYQSALKQQEARNMHAKAAIDKAINPLIMERTLEELRNQDIDVLSLKHTGIRIKALREYGYRNMADLYAASLYQLASVYGISLDSARVIKRTVNEIAQEVAKTVKLKISSDERTEAATAVLKAAWQYDYYKKASRSITPDCKKQLKESGFHAAVLSGLHNNLCWILTTPSQKQQFIKAYQSAAANLNPSLINAVQTYSRAVMKDVQITDDQVWADFSSRSIEYFNLLEELYPGAFGNDDLLYGLPEDLAREIQEQVYFPDGLKVSLRRYQEWGVKYILHQSRVLLGDEMGLGKTVQAIAAMVSLRNTGAKKFLVVCPASVLPNWCKEIEKKSEFHSIMVHGNGRQAAFDSWNKNGGVAVTTYETLSSLSIPAELEYDLLVVDEAHFIKNENTIRSQNVRLYGTYAKRLLYMTGTALENKVEEMLSLLHILNPKVAAQAKKIAFMSTAPQFRKIIAPVYYRRKREDVLTELPAITYSKEWCDLLPEEYDDYEKAVLAKDRTNIRRVSWNMDNPSQSAKVRRLKEIVEEAESDGRKILVFSFYLDTIERVIEVLGQRCTSPINGSVPVQKRQQIIDEFESMDPGAVLPAQIQAGGTGLNIQSASVVIICEPQLKPSIENQAISRAYRMGQTRKVLVYRLLASNTIDERIDDMLTEKQAIFDAFADISEAVTDKEKEEYQIDDKTFGKLILEEIDRINAGKENTSAAPASIQTAQTRVRNNPPPSAGSMPPPSAVTAQSSARDLPHTDSVTTPLRPQQNTMFSPVLTMETGRRPSEPVLEPLKPRGQSTAKPLSHGNHPEEAKNPRDSAGKFNTLESFMKYAEQNGVPVKDNREKGGCVWIGSAPGIDPLIKGLIFGDRGFKYSARSKTLGGSPGWYY